MRKRNKWMDVTRDGGMRGRWDKSATDEETGDGIGGIGMNG